VESETLPVLRGGAGARVTLMHHLRIKFFSTNFMASNMLFIIDFSDFFKTNTCVSRPNLVYRLTHFDSYLVHVVISKRSYNCDKRE
jgi:hypothetical protein